MQMEERDAFEEHMREIDECHTEKFSTLDSREKTIAILGDRWWPQTTKQEGDIISNIAVRNTLKKRNNGPNVGGASTRMLRLERDAWSMVK